jgi:hypothetical protein
MPSTGITSYNGTSGPEYFWLAYHPDKVQSI